MVLKSYTLSIRYFIIIDHNAFQMSNNVWKITTKNTQNSEVGCTGGDGKNLRIALLETSIERRIEHGWQQISLTLRNIPVCSQIEFKWQIGIMHLNINYVIEKKKKKTKTKIRTNTCLLFTKVGFTGFFSSLFEFHSKFLNYCYFVITSNVITLSFRRLKFHFQCSMFSVWLDLCMLLNCMMV